MDSQQASWQQKIEQRERRQRVVVDPLASWKM